MSPTPKFDNPPVRQVAIGIQFAALPNLRGAHFGLFWARLRDRYPRLGEAPPIAPAYETFGGLRAQQIQFQFSMPGTTPRVLMESQDGQWVVQFQQDRFVLNWQSLDRFPYPEWGDLHPRFSEELYGFVKFLNDESLGELAINQVELNYLNFIHTNETDNQHEQLAKITPLFRNVTTQVLDLEPDSIVLSYRRIMRRGQERVGRTYVEFAPVVQPTSGEHIYSLNITSRGLPASTSPEAALEFLDEAHRAVVTSFAAVTNEELHREWGRHERR